MVTLLDHSCVRFFGRFHLSRGNPTGLPMVRWRPTMMTWRVCIGFEMGDLDLGRLRQNDGEMLDFLRTPSAANVTVHCRSSKTEPA